MADRQINNKGQKILFITQDDPFYVRLFFDEFLSLYPDKNNILGVVICSTMGKKSVRDLTKQMFSFYGIKDFLRMCWRYTVVKSKGQTLKRLCADFRIPVFQGQDINSPEFISYWKDKHLDVIVSVAAPSVFREKLINLPKWGCINIHHARLPNYRGMMPNFWQMYHGNKTAGITVHRINTRIDEGEIILQKEIPIEDSYSLNDLISYSKRVGARCIIEALELIRENKVNFIPNDKANGSYFSFPTRADVVEFRRCGKRLL